MVKWEPDNLISRRIYYALTNLLSYATWGVAPGFCIARLWRFDSTLRRHIGFPVCYNFDEEDETKAANIGPGISVLGTHDLRPISRIQRALEEPEHRAGD